MAVQPIPVVPGDDWDFEIPVPEDLTGCTVLKRRVKGPKADFEVNVQPLDRKVRVTAGREVTAALAYGAGAGALTIQIEMEDGKSTTIIHRQLDGSKARRELVEEAGFYGLQGARGPGWLFGEGVPDDSLGVDRERYVDELTRQVYAKEAGAWSFTGQIIATDAAVQAAKSAAEFAAGQATAGAGQTAADVLVVTAMKQQVEAARDAANVIGPKHATEAIGRLTVANGVNFFVQGSGDVAAYEYRRIDENTISTLIATYPSKAVVDQAALAAYRVALGSFRGEGAPGLEPPVAVTEDGRLLAIRSSAGEIIDLVAAEQKYKLALGNYRASGFDATFLPVIVSEDNRVLTGIGNDDGSVPAVTDETLYRALLGQYRGETNDPDAAPERVTEDNRVIQTTQAAGAATVADYVAYTVDGKLWAIGGGATARIVNEDPGKTWLAAEALPGRIRARYIDHGGQMRLASVSLQNGNVYADDCTHVIIGGGQSNMRGTGGPNNERYLVRSIYPYSESLLTGATTSGNQWLGIANSNLDPFVPESMTGFAPLRGKLDGSSGTTALESAALRICDTAYSDLGGYVPKLLAANLAVGANRIAWLSKDPPAVDDEGDPWPAPGLQPWANVEKVIGRLQALCPPRERLVLGWAPFTQGEGDTGDVLLADKHDAWRADIEELVQDIFGQTEPVRMISWQPSSFGSANGARSILTYYLANRQMHGRFWCGGPLYQFPFSSDYLHSTSGGHDLRGEFDAEIMRLVERTGDWQPLYMVSATKVDTHKVRILMSEDVVNDTTDDVVALIANAGIQIGSRAISAVSLAGPEIDVTTTTEIEIGDAVKMALNVQTTPRTAAAIPRSTIRAAATIGTYRNGQAMKVFACHQELLTA